MAEEGVWLTGMYTTADGHLQTRPGLMGVRDESIEYAEPDGSV